MVTQPHIYLYEVKEIKKQLDRSLGNLIFKLQDKSIPLDERWDVYSEIVDLGILSNGESYGDGYIDFLDKNYSLYDDFNIERHETRTFLTILEIVDDFDNKPSEEAIINWKEQVLISGYSRFTYDW